MYFSDTVIAVVVIGYVILRERSEALHTSLSFRMQYPVILNEVKNLFNNNMQSETSNLSDPDAIDAVRNNRYSVASLLTASLRMTNTRL